MLALTTALYFVSILVYPPYYCVSFVRTLGWRVALTTSIFWLPVLITIANSCASAIHHAASGH